MKQRTFITTILLLTALTAAAQNYSPCYKEKYEAGVSLYNKGDYNGAKAKFVASKSCPMPNTAQADEWIKKCNAKITPAPPKVSASTDAAGNQIFAVGGVTFKMVKVEGGTFEMGCTSEQGGDCNKNETPKHTVTLSEYYIGETEVTQALWKAVMGSNPSHFKGNNRPVESISWDDCQAFVNKLNNLLRNSLPSGYKFALPTEAQWEYAARGGKHQSPDKYSGSNSIDEVAWYFVNSFDKGPGSPDYGTHVVKTKMANALGLYDMSGNVQEWCADWYLSDYYGASPSTNPQGSSTGQYRVLRGGRWDSYAKICRVSYRHNNTPDSRPYFNGFRLALVHQ